MAKFKVKNAESVDALQFSGGNWVTMQNHVGTHSLDPNGSYKVPNFDDADTWWPERPDPNIKAVLYVNGEWTGVRATEWVIKAPDGSLSIMSDEDFTAQYEPATA